MKSSKTLKTSTPKRATKAKRSPADLASLLSHAFRIPVSVTDNVDRTITAVPKRKPRLKRKFTNLCDIIKMAKRGRKLKYNTKVVARILAALRNGVPHKYAALTAGISYDSFLRYRKEYPEFDQKVETAEAEFLEYHMAALMKHAREGNAGASMFSLERRFPQYFARPETAIQINQVNSAAERASINALWTRPPQLPAQQHPELAWGQERDLENEPDPTCVTPSLPAPSCPAVRESEQRKQDARLPANPVEPGMSELSERMARSGFVPATPLEKEIHRIAEGKTLDDTTPVVPLRSVPQVQAGFGNLDLTFDP